MTGILTNNVKEVREIMREELISFVGYGPNIKTEYNQIEGEGYLNKINSNQYVATNPVCGI